jgi:hypothetical protein
LGAPQLPCSSPATTYPPPPGARSACCFIVVLVFLLPHRHRRVGLPAASSPCWSSCCLKRAVLVFLVLIAMLFILFVHPGAHRRGVHPLAGGGPACWSSSLRGRSCWAATSLTEIKIQISKSGKFKSQCFNAFVVISCFIWVLALVICVLVLARMSACVC